MFVKITSFLGGKRAIKSLGAFCMLAFGVPSIILSLQMNELEPSWPMWIFFGGTILGLILLIGGIFAIDVSENK